MEKVIIIKYGELTIKKNNIKFFIKKLIDNINISLKGIEYDLKYDHGRMFIKTKELDLVLNKLSKVFGIHEINTGYILEKNDIEYIGKFLIDNLKENVFSSFKVETKRSYKNYPLNSMEISRKLGGYLLKNIDSIKVDVHNPELLINIEIRKDEAVVYYDKHKGLGGYPVGTLGKGVLMLSGGIDSPVAGYLAIKRGVSLTALYFDSPPHTSQSAKDKVIELASKLKEYDSNLTLYVVKFTEIQELILKNIPHEYLITIMRRMMYRIAERLAHKIKGHIIVNGESIGQVASQTLTSMKAINEVVKVPVIRPVACLDKLEIIDIAKKIDTYETSILPFEDCCTIFVPEHPVINPESKKCEEYEKLIEYEDLLYKSVKEAEILKLNKENNFGSLL